MSCAFKDKDGNLCPNEPAERRKYCETHIKYFEDLRRIKQKKRDSDLVQVWSGDKLIEISIKIDKEIFAKIMKDVKL